MGHLPIDEEVLKLFSIYWFNDERSLVAIKNDLVDYVLRLKKSYGAYDKVPEKYQVEIFYLMPMSGLNKLTFDTLSKRLIPLNKVRPEFVPINHIGL